MLIGVNDVCAMGLKKLRDHRNEPAPVRTIYQQDGSIRQEKLAS